MIIYNYDVNTKTVTTAEVPDNPSAELEQIVSIDERVNAVETDVDDIITVLAVIEGVLV